MCICHHDDSRSYLNFKIGKEQFLSTTPFAVHYEKLCTHLREKANYCLKLHLSATKNDPERFLYLNQHSIAIYGILVRQMLYKREKYTFISDDLQVINAILNANGDNTQTF